MCICANSDRLEGNMYEGQYCIPLISMKKLTVLGVLVQWIWRPHKHACLGLIPTCDSTFPPPFFFFFCTTESHYLGHDIAKYDCTLCCLAEVCPPGCYHRLKMSILLSLVSSECVCQGRPGKNQFKTIVLLYLVIHFLEFL